MNSTILIVDDEQMITSTLATLIKMVLKQSVVVYNDPLEALNSEVLSENKVDLIISDFMMPGMNGIEFLSNVKKICPDVVTVLLTGYADKENAIRSINEVGIYYYLEKPWDNSNLIKIIKNGIEKKQLTDDLNSKCYELKSSNDEIERLYNLLKMDYEKEVDNIKNLIVTLANVIEAKDSYTDGHTRRVAAISKLLGLKLGLAGDDLINLEISGIIHDIGKVGVPENILNKPGKLTKEEFDIMKKHTVVGETICKPLKCLTPCLDGVRHHHEKLNGKGYPDGLSNEEISIYARILSVADIFDALTSDRPYRARLQMDQVRKIMYEDVETGALDRNVVNLLFEMVDNNSLANYIA